MNRSETTITVPALVKAAIERGIIERSCRLARLFFAAHVLADQAEKEFSQENIAMWKKQIDDFNVLLAEEPGSKPEKSDYNALGFAFCYLMGGSDADRLKVFPNQESLLERSDKWRRANNNIECMLDKFERISQHAHFA